MSLTLTQSVLCRLVYQLARKLRRRLAATETGQLPTFRNRTLTALVDALNEAAPALAGTTAGNAVNELALAMCNITPDDLRRTPLLRQQIAQELEWAEATLRKPLTTLTEETP